MFGFLKKKSKKGEAPMTTLEQVKKAYEDLSDEDKKSFHQSLSDRVHESIAAQEKDKGDKDSQSAEDREHEALGAEHADGEGNVDELHETDPEEKPEEKAEESDEEKPEETAENDEADEENKGGSALEKIVREAVAEEVKKALAEMVKPSKEETEPTPVKDKKALSAIEAIYS